MAIAITTTLRNLKVKYKLFLILAVLFALIVNLTVLNIVSVREMQSQTEHLSEEIIPRLLATSEIQHHIHLSILSTYDYVHTGNEKSKLEYKHGMHMATESAIQLFYLSQSHADFEFTNSFQNHINNISTSLDALVEAYESGTDAKTLETYIEDVTQYQDEFTDFIDDEINTTVQQEAEEERAQSAERVQQVTYIVIAIGFAAVVILVAVYIFTHRSITSPIEKLTSVAEDISHGQFRPANIDNRDELGVFADTFNTMIQKLQATQEVLTIELQKRKELDQQKSEFLSIAAHQLRTPISGIKWMMGMAANGDFGEMPPELKDQLQKGLANINRMTLLINDLLDVTQLEQQKISYTLIPVSIPDMMQTVIDELMPLAKKDEVSVVVESPEDPLPLVDADASKLRMAFHNIVDNAIKYTPAGGKVTIQYSYAREQVVVHVVDNGYGIPLDEQDHIFSKLYRGSNIQKIRLDGSGLGLFIAREIVRSHNGDILFESTEGKGSHFYIMLPIA